MFKKLNKVILCLTLSDSFTWGPLVIISNLAGLYLAENLGQDIVSFIGIGTGIYFFTRAAFQMPIGYITDKLKDDKDEIILLTFGIVLMGLPYLFYPSITKPFHYFILQFVLGLGVSMNLPSWRKLFALNLKQGNEGFQYGFYETILSISTAIFSASIGYIANFGDIYFDLTMRVVGILMMLAGIWSLLIFSVKDRKSNGGEETIAVEKVTK